MKVRRGSEIMIGDVQEKGGSVKKGESKKQRTE